MFARAQFEKHVLHRVSIIGYRFSGIFRAWITHFSNDQSAISPSGEELIRTPFGIAISPAAFLFGPRQNHVRSSSHATKELRQFNRVAGRHEVHDSCASKTLILDREIMTPWENQIVIALARHLRVLSLEQIQRTWWSGQRTGQRRARKSIELLAKNGWLRLRHAFSRPIVRLEAPLVSWHHGRPEPDFALVANYLRRRARTEAKVMVVVTAQPKARRLFGVGEQRRLKLTQITHDLHVSEVFLRYLQSGVDVFRDWISEDCIPKPWPLRERPDALLRDEVGEIRHAVEYGGEYTALRLAKLHHGFWGLTMPYELW